MFRAEQSRAGASPIIPAVRRLKTLPWLIRQTPHGSATAAGLLVVANAALLATLWTDRGAHTLVVASAVLDFAAFFWLYRDLSAAYVDRMMSSAAAMMDAVVTVAPDRSIVLFNPAAEATFGYAARDVLGQPVDCLIPPRLRERHRRHMEEFTRSGQANRRLGRPGEFFALRASGEEFPVDASVMQVGEGAGKLYTMILRDATRRLEARVRAERLAAIVESTDEAIVTVDTQRRVTHWNPGAERMTGYAAHEVLGQRLDMLYPPEHPTIAGPALQGQRIVNHVTRRMRKDGVLIDIAQSTAPIHDEHGNITGVSAVARDITGELAAERARAEGVERLHSLAQRLMRAEEEQRRLLGRELHDQVGANLATLGLSLQLIREQSDPATLAPIATRLEFCEGLLRETADGVRSVLNDLRPAALDELGLLAALRQLAATMERSGLMRFSAEGQEPSPRLHPGASIALYRIAQEAFTNAAKHSGASKVTARLSQEGAEVTLLIADDGHWRREAETASRAAGLGLTTMHERAEAVGASLEVWSGAAGGTTVTLRLPRAAAPLQENT
jgi:PAS domain S-box-containing protein